MVQADSPLHTLGLVARLTTSQAHLTPFPQLGKGWRAIPRNNLLIACIKNFFFLKWFRR